MRDFVIAIRLFIAMTVITGIAYPLLVTGIAQTALPNQANGSLIESNGKILGSRLIGQPFDDPKFFWSRPSATAPFPYNAGASSGANQGPTNPALVGGIGSDGKPVRGAIADRVTALKAADPGYDAPVPTDLVTASASGLDPHISVAAARYQIHRIAKLRGMTEAALADLVDKHTAPRLLGVFGEPVVNVLELNLNLENK